MTDCTCGGTVTGIGCFNDSLRSSILPDLLLTDRDKTSNRYSNKPIEWNNWNEYMEDIVCRCADKTRETNHKIFGIQYYGKVYKIGTN